MTIKINGVELQPKNVQEPKKIAPKDWFTILLSLVSGILTGYFLVDFITHLISG